MCTPSPTVTPVVSGLSLSSFCPPSACSFFRGITYHLGGEVTKSVWRFALFEGIKELYKKHYLQNEKATLGVWDNIVVSSLSATGETFFVVQPWDRLKVRGFFIYIYIRWIVCCLSLS